MTYDLSKKHYLPLAVTYPPSDYFRHSRTIFDHLRTFQTVSKTLRHSSDGLRPSQTLRHSQTILKTFETLSDCLRPSQTISEHLRPLINS